MQDTVEKHWAILDDALPTLPNDALPRNFPANVRISVCNAPLIYPTWVLMRVGIGKYENHFGTLDMGRGAEIC